jgi:hypothetical protein
VLSDSKRLILLILILSNSYFGGIDGEFDEEDGRVDFCEMILGNFLIFS